MFKRRGASARQSRNGRAGDVQTRSRAVTWALHIRTDAYVCIYRASRPSNKSQSDCCLHANPCKTRTARGTRNVISRFLSGYAVDCVDEIRLRRVARHFRLRKPQLRHELYRFPLNIARLLSDDIRHVRPANDDSVAIQINRRSSTPQRRNRTRIPKKTYK